MQAAMVEMVASGKYLWFPVANGAPLRLVTVAASQGTVFQFEIELAPAEPDFWVFLDVERFRGAHLRITADDPLAAKALQSVVHSDEWLGADELYREALRPQFHFSSRRGWLNDPNGLVYYDGEYHLFYQHNPYGWKWGNMHWGHAVSRDLVHWTELGEALYPSDFGTMWSGSGVVDWENTSGFGTGAEPPLVLIYTAAGGTSARSEGRPFTQCLAYSNDRGRTWNHYAHNPVVGEMQKGTRDPKVIWHAPTRQWVMALYVDESRYALLTSPDLKQWTQTDTLVLPGCDECPDLFELPIDGDPSQTKWVFWAASGRYLVGEFDGTSFHPETELLRAVHGGNSYAAQTWSDVPSDDGRRIQISWMRFDLPGMPFNCFMTFPNELTLRTTPEGPRLHTQPASELARLCTASHLWADERLTEGQPLVHATANLCAVDLRLHVGEATSVDLRVPGAQIAFDVQSGILSCGKYKTEVPLNDGVLGMRVLVDRSSVEVYAGDGLIYLPMGVLKEPATRGVTLEIRGGEAAIKRFEIAELKSAWPVEACKRV